MNKKRLLVALALFVYQQGVAQDVRWQKIHLDDSTTIDFPGTPDKKLVGSQQATSFRDDEAIYSVITQKNVYGGNPIDSELKRFYAETLKGMMEAFGGGEVVDDRPFTVNSFPGRQIQITTPNKPQLPPVKIVRFLLANGTFYTVNFWTSTDEDPRIDSARNHFFASFQTTMKRTAAVDPETQTMAYKLGSLIGTLFAYGAMIYVLVVIVRRILKPKAA